MTKFEKIKEIIRKYQENADKHYLNYKEAESKARIKFSSEGFRDEFVHGTWVTMAGQAWANQDAAIRDVNEIFDQIEKDLSDWVMNPLDAGTVQILNCIGNFGLKLSLDELQIIEKSVRDSYFGTRIFAGMAEKNGYGIKIPGIRECREALGHTRGDSEFAIRAYAGAGPDFPGKDLLNEWEHQGTKLGEYEDLHLYAAANFLHNDGELDRLEKMWGMLKAPMKYTLTDKEADRVKKTVEKIVNKSGEVDNKAAQELINKEPDIKSKLESMPEWDFPGMDSVNKYFSLNGTDKGSNESKIDAATQKPTEINLGLGKVNEDILNQFN